MLGQAGALHIHLRNGLLSICSRIPAKHWNWIGKPQLSPALIELSIDLQAFPGGLIVLDDGTMYRSHLRDARVQEVAGIVTMKYRKT